MAQPIQTGHGTTVLFATSGFVAKFRSIGSFEQSREALDSTHLATVDFRTKEPGDVADAGSFEGEFFYDTDVQPPINGPKEQITIEFPDGATISGLGFITSWSSPEAATDQLMVSNLTVTWAEGPNFADA